MTPYETETRLKSYLDTNQLARERICLAVLATDKRFSNIKPRHPRGGRDKGVDIDAMFNGTQIAVGAIGFVSGANDSTLHKRTIKKKFKEDAASGLRDLITEDGHSLPKPEVFAFFTNLDLSVSEEDGLITFAKSLGFAGCEIFDRERLRIALDSVDGFAARFQYLGMSLSEAEQASFFSRWGDDIQAVISSGFTGVHRTLNRLLFLQEAHDTLNGLYIRYELDREYSADEINHVRAFVALTLTEPKLDIFQVMFGMSDNADRYSDNGPRRERLGIKNGLGGAYWEQAPVAKDEREWQTVGSWSSVGQDPVKSVTAHYSHDNGLLRLRPRLVLADLQDAIYIHYLNASLAEKLARIHVMANGYKLAVYEKDQFLIDAEPFEPTIPVEFSTDEMKDQWVKIRGTRSSAFKIEFSDWTPKRMFESQEVPG